MTLLDTYLPYDAGAGANVLESQWETFADPWLPTGIVGGVGSEFAVIQRAAGANMSIDVGTGEARIKGMQGVSSSVKNLAIAANGSGNPRVDLVVLRNDFVNNRILVDVLQGTAAANPVEAALTQNSSTWEEPLAAIDVAAAAASILTANIRDRRTFSRVYRQSRFKDPVRFATTTALAASTITGTKRVANANGALGAVDGITGAAGDRLLDKDHGTGSARGIWKLVDPGSASTPWRMERPYDLDESSDVAANTLVFVSEGTTLADTAWQITTNDPIVLGTTALTFAQFPTPAATPAMTLIQTQTVAGSDVASVDFTSIPAIYSHLRLVCYLRSASAVVTDPFYLRLNADGAGNYDYERAPAVDAAAATGVLGNAASEVYWVGIPGANSPANAFGAVVVDFPAYALTVNHKSFVGLLGHRGDATTGRTVGMGWGGWRNTAAINAIKVFANGNLKVGSVVSLYGIL